MIPEQKALSLKLYFSYKKFVKYLQIGQKYRLSKTGHHLIFFCPGLQHGNPSTFYF